MALSTSLLHAVWQRAGSRCEYCHLPSECDVLPFCIDHIVAQKHHGKTADANLALSCLPCNSFKLDNLSGIDPVTGEIVTLFHPRNDEWTEHFFWRGALLMGRTAIARATIDVLKINLLARLDHRQFLLRVGKFPQP